MTIEAFQTLCEGLSELTGGLCTVSRNARLPGLSLRLRDVLINVAPGPGADSLLLAAEVSEREHLSLAEWQTLLDGNMAMHGARPRFGRDPNSRRAVLMWPDRLSASAVIETYQRAEAMAECVSNWTTKGTMPVLHQPARDAQSRDGAHEVDYRTRAESLRNALARDESSLQPPEEGEPWGFRVHVGGVDFLASHLPAYREDALAFGFLLSDRHSADKLDDVTAVMDANCLLGLRSDTPLICREPVGGRLMMRFDYALDGASADDLLRCLVPFVPLGLGGVGEHHTMDPHVAAGGRDAAPRR